MKFSERMVSRKKSSEYYNFAVDYFYNAITLY